jgi:nickel/cobalt transporter (NicO) family protein
MRRLLVVALLASVLTPAGAGAHPLGNFTVNQYARIEVAPSGVAVRFVLDQAEIPTLQLVQRYDRNGSGGLDGDELSTAEEALGRDVVAALSVTVDGRPVVVRRDRTRLVLPAGQAGLRTSRLELDLDLAGIRLRAAPSHISYSSRYAADRIGWKEVVVARRDGAAVTATTANAVDRTNGLRSYPAAAQATPPDMLAADVTARLGDGGVAVGLVAADGNVGADRAGDDGFSALVDPGRSLTPAFVALALLLAAAWGALHALSPGHGKTMVAAYLAGSRGSARHAFALGAAVTVTHTSTVFALGAVTLALSGTFAPEDLFPWLTLASGVLVLGLGLAAIRDRLRIWRRTAAPVADAGHGHAHDHGHAHGHDHHAPADGLTWRSLAALGVSGGIIPCPSALVLLLSAIALDRAAFGIALVAAFSLGLAGVISALGLAVLYARRAFARIPSTGRVLHALPVVSAVVITVLGVVLTARALPGIA